jgi:hypothetical protein
VILRKVPPSDLFVALPEPLKHPQGVDSGQSHNQQETAKPN